MSSDSEQRLKSKIGDGEIRTRIEHKRYGVWDYYEEFDLTNRPWLVTAPILDQWNEIVQCSPYVVRMLKDVFNIPGCNVLMLEYATTELGMALIPAVTVWFHGQLLHITQVAIESRTVDKERLLRAIVGQVSCSVFTFILRRMQQRVEIPLNGRIRRWWAVHSFHAHARLDLPTFEQGKVRKDLKDTLDNYWGDAVIWQCLELVIAIFSLAMRLAVQVVVLVKVLRVQKDGVLLGLLTLLAETISFLSRTGLMKPVRVWLATTANKDYIRMHGWKTVVQNKDYRKEFVAGNLADYATSEFKKACERVGERDADWYEIQNLVDFYGEFWATVSQPLTHIPQIIFTLRAARSPASIPVSLASLTLVQNTASEFAWTVYEVINKTRRIENQLASVRKVYEVVNIPNLVVDGTIPFPEDTTQIRLGVSLEFKNVSFKYPEAKKYALRNVSFSLGAGQLCVIVGVNGSGKSTILKLITRLYDPEEGQILINGHDIRTLKLRDLRQAISVLFQDYTIFPLSIHDNIAMGDPATANDDDRVRLAARLAGAEGLVEKLPDGFDTYLERPVYDRQSRTTEGKRTWTGRVISYAPLREAAGIKNWEDSSLSGGQKQRLAVARTFMRSVVQDDTTVGLLLFDEPSAALDPAAEHDLFERLRGLRGSKTMIFSSHRFGNLTRHSDLILYMDDSVVVEAGTHEQLLKRGGEYARLWKLQAQAFVE